MDYDKCPKCGGKTGTYRHLYARVWCLDCGFVLREEGEGAPPKPVIPDEMIEVGQLSVGKHGFSIGVDNQLIDITKLHGNYKLYIKIN